MRGVLTLKSVYSVDVDDLGNHLWSGAKDRWDDATDEQRERVFSMMEDIFWDEDEIDDGKVNDFIWFDCDDIFFEEESEDESEDEDDVTDEDEEDDSLYDGEHYELICGEGSIEKGFRENKGKWIVGHNKFDNLLDAAVNTALNEDYDIKDKFLSLENAKDELARCTSEVYEISPKTIWARVVLVAHIDENGNFEIVETAKWDNQVEG